MNSNESLDNISNNFIRAWADAYKKGNVNYIHQSIIAMANMRGLYIKGMTNEQALNALLDNINEEAEKVRFNDMKDAFDKIIRNATIRAKELHKYGPSNIHESIITISAGRQLGHTNYIILNVKEGDTIITQSDSMSKFIKSEMIARNMNIKDYHIMSLIQFDTHSRGKPIEEGKTYWVDAWISTPKETHLYSRMLDAIQQTKLNKFVRVIQFGKVTVHSTWKDEKDEYYSAFKTILDYNIKRIALAEKLGQQKSIEDRAFSIVTGGVEDNIRFVADNATKEDIIVVDSRYYFETSFKNLQVYTIREMMSVKIPIHISTRMWIVGSTGINQNDANDLSCALHNAFESKNPSTPRFIINIG